MSGTSQIFLDIKNRLEAVNPYFPYPKTFVPSKTGKFVYMWNKSMKNLKDGKWAGVTPPLIFIEQSDIIIEQYGNGTIVQDMTLKLHIIDKFFNSTDGLVNFDQDLRIFDFKDWVFQMLQMFPPTNCGVMLLTRETPPNDHDMLVEYVQEWRLKFSNTLVDQPINGQEMKDTTTLDSTIIIDKTTNP